MPKTREENNSKQADVISVGVRYTWGWCIFSSKTFLPQEEQVRQQQPTTYPQVAMDHTLFTKKKREAFS